MIDTAVILAAGRGTRLKEITKSRSKGLAPIAGLPMIGRVIHRLREAGITTLVVVTAPRDDEIRAYLSTIPAVSVVVQNEPRGSADALRACSKLMPARFLVCACDSLVSAAHIRELLTIHHTEEAAVTLSVMEVSSDESLASRSVVKLDGARVLDIIEKPKAEERLSNITSLPLYALSSEIFREIELLPVSPRGEYELPEAIRGMIRKGAKAVAARTALRHDLTNARDLLALNCLFLDAMSPSVRVHPSVSIPASSMLMGPVLIEEGVEIGEGVSLGPFVYLERSVRVLAGTSLKRVVVTRGARVSGRVEGEVVV